jgi:hypothetical protein
MNSVPKTPTVSLATLSPGERVGIHVRPLSSDDSAERWVGVILAVDVLGLRLRAESCRVAGHSYAEAGQLFWPWASIESVEIAQAPE